jgi:hypothetical protein
MLVSLGLVALLERRKNIPILKLGLSTMNNVQFLKYSVTFVIFLSHSTRIQTNFKEAATDSFFIPITSSVFNQSRDVTTL